MFHDTICALDCERSHVQLMQRLVLGNKETRRYALTNEQFM